MSSTLVPARPFDLRRMFLGDEEPMFLLEVAARTTIIFVYTLLLLRVLGKRGVAQLSLFELTIIIGLGSAVGDPMFQPDVPLVHAMLVIGVIVLLYRVLTGLMRKSEPFERFVEGTPSCVVKNGRVDLAALAAEHISPEELFEILRSNGVAQLGEVKRAYLEQSGSLSVFAFPPREVFAGLPIVPPWDIREGDALRSRGDAVEPGAYACRFCGEVAKLDAKRALPQCSRCRQGEWLPASRAPLGAGVKGTDEPPE